MPRRPKTAQAVPEGEEGMWTLQRTAAFLGRPRGTLYQWVHNGFGPPSYKVGNSRMYKPSEVREWLAARRSAPAA